MFFTLTIKLFLFSLGLIYSLQPNWSWEGIPLVAHLFEGVGVRIRVLGIQRHWRGEMCQQRVSAVSQPCLHLPREGPSGPGNEKLLIDGVTCVEAQRGKAMCCSPSSLWLLSQGCANPLDHQPPSMELCFITGVTGGCMMFYNICSHSLPSLSPPPVLRGRSDSVCWAPRVNHIFSPLQPRWGRWISACSTIKKTTHCTARSIKPRYV